MMGMKRTTILQASCGPLGTVIPRPRWRIQPPKRAGKTLFTLFFPTQFPHQPTLTLLLALGSLSFISIQQSSAADNLMSIGRLECLVLPVLQMILLEKQNENENRTNPFTTAPISDGPKEWGSQAIRQLAFTQMAGVGKGNRPRGFFRVGRVKQGR